jgi:hypothetical protein
VRILAIVLDLRSARKPIAKAEYRLPWPPQVPAIDISVNGAGCQEIWVVCGEVDVGDGPIVGLKRMLDGARGRVVPLIEIPDETAMVRCGCNPVVPRCKGRPLYVDHEPREPMAAQPARRAIWRVQIYDGKAFGSGSCSVSTRDIGT